MAAFEIREADGDASDQASPQATWIAASPAPAPARAPLRAPSATAPRDPPLQAAHAAHREFLASHRSKIRGFVGSRVSDHAEAEDVTQQTLQQALRKLDSFQGGNLRAWLYCIARRVLSNRRRDSARLVFMEFDAQDLHAAEQVLRTAADSVPMAYDARARIQCCLECLAMRLRLVEGVAVLLADVHGFSDSEAAERLRMSLPNFKFLLHKARQRLHAAAAAEGGDDSCPLVSKTGVLRACPGCAPAEGRTVRGGDSRTQPSGLDETALAGLCRELVVALAVEQ